MYTYLLINLFSILIPVLLSFEPRVFYFKNWKYVFCSSGLIGLFFIVWDAVFTHWGVWGFNPKYLTGIYLVGLPIEEIMFFFCIPFSCIFIYDIVRRLQTKDVFAPFLYPLTYALVMILSFIGLFNLDKIYTSITFLSLALLLFLHARILKTAYLGYFLQAYVISIIPFLIVNGLLTNGLRFIDSGPVVWYNNAANLSVRIMGIPVEDFMYSMLLLLLNIGMYEYLKNKRS